MRKLVDQPCFGQRKRAAQQMLLQQAEQTGVETVESPDALDALRALGIGHERRSEKGYLPVYTIWLLEASNLCAVHSTWYVHGSSKELGRCPESGSAPRTRTRPWICFPLPHYVPRNLGR